MHHKSIFVRDSQISSILGIEGKFSARGIRELLGTISK